MNNYLYSGAASRTICMAQGIAQFVRQIEGAFVLLMAAHADESNAVMPATFADWHGKNSSRGGWQMHAINIVSVHLRHIINLAKHHPAQGAAITAEYEAFRMLSELTPSGPLLLQLFCQDRSLAWKRLADQLNMIQRNFVKTMEALGAIPHAGRDGTSPKTANEANFMNVKADILKRANGTLSLTEAAGRLGISRQALHKKISHGGAIGMMFGKYIILPNLQFHVDSGKFSILRGISEVNMLFKESESNGWAELQFLVDHDPNLQKSPIEALREGLVSDVVQSARAYLHIDEE